VGSGDYWLIGTTNAMDDHGRFQFFKVEFKGNHAKTTIMAKTDQQW
jgi:hypothetical protein